MKIFNEVNLSSFIQEQYIKIKDELNQQKEDYLLNVNENEFIEYLSSKYMINDMDILWDECSYTEEENFVNVQDSFERRTITAKRPVITLEIPFVGNRELFRYIPSTKVWWTQEVSICNNCIYLDVIIDDGDMEKVNTKFDSFKRLAAQQLSNVKNDINNFNNNLKINIEDTFKSKKGHILKKREELMKIKLPIKKKDNVPQTFTIPPINLRKDIIISKPVASTVTSYIPEPTMDTAQYHEILSLINDMGKEFERLPSTSKSKGEEDLRDFILLMLQPHFTGSVTGETFNHTGKTDILLRYENSNVFIAECKFWKGEKGYLATIDQLLNYLTWRDSKVAVIVFVRGREFSQVINKIKEATPKHSNYISHVNDSDETWFNYEFHLNGDVDRKLKLAVMVYNIPS